MLRQTLSIIAVVVLAAGCDDKKTETAPTPAAPVTQPAPAVNAAPAAAPAAAPTGAAPAVAVATGGKGDVKGSVKLNGKAPEMAELKRSTDPFCGKTKMKDQEVVGNLGNVLIHINGAPAAEPPADKAKIEQTNCMYTPRVQGVVAGQTLDIKNGDPVLHNVHTYKGTSTLFNQAQVPNTPDIEKKFDNNGAMLKFKCDVHQWMTGFVWVQNNPYFAVTKDDGSFEIKGVPAGKYEIEAWHERFGAKKGEVTVEPGKPAEVKFEYAATDK
ncbi:MAG TPA: carboxypeptidase regulatory-like domain-containing protein [Polyangia bacterium]|nr:carboxypeptidase regulatory-like domain-containing protein [Polyangia bacterium]